jgi:bifunctional DNA-binding transcriptional regulator/antitoxin component of YhaV-PrlF toxin-antitoxin module
MLAKLTRGNQITIPKEIVLQARLKQGNDYLDIEYSDGLIYLKPIELEERIPHEVLEKFQSQAAKMEKGDILLKGQEAEGFLKKRAKK